MHWTKLGIVWRPDGSFEWARSHAMIPTPFQIASDRVRVFVTCCDDHGIGRCGYVDVDASDPKRVLSFSKRPVLDIGRPGTFDENGVLACCVVEGEGGRLYMYYVGFELGTRIRYRLLTGLAISDDGGESFCRHSECPVLERSDSELLFRCGPFVLREQGVYRLWYVAGSEWTEVSGKAKPKYTIKYAESTDGIEWPLAGTALLEVANPDEHGFGRPWVVRRDPSLYEMFYSIRRRSLDAYRLGYAVSRDGRQWSRSDHELNLGVSPQGFDSEAIMYSAVIDLAGHAYCFYNGNEFGRDGFAVAVRSDAR
jgi:predicted GH43/DUF377 family glycosyl hydrolase